jgi:hypothetical protein
MDEQAKAAGEIAKATGKGIDAAREAGGFFAKYIDGSLEQAMGILEDRLKFIRWEKKLHLLKKADTILKRQGPSLTRRPVPLKLAIPILEDGSLEEDESLQDIWAQLLANAADARSGIEVRRAFLSILKDLSPLDASNLLKIYEAPDPRTFNAIDITGLPEIAIATAPSMFAFTYTAHVLNPEIEISIRNLARLGLLESVPVSTDMGSLITNVFSGVYRTELGRAFIKACSAN